VAHKMQKRLYGEIHGYLITKTSFFHFETYKCSFNFKARLQSTKLISNKIFL
jgi:hypothetical protein